MDIQSISANTQSEIHSAGLNSTAGAAATLGKDAFFKLLISQLQNQDPLNPADPTEFTAQLAQFSSLEQLSNVNDNLYALKLYQASINNAQAVAFIGKQILASGNEIEKAGTEPLELEFDLSAAAKSVVVSIYDAAGNYVGEVVRTDLSAGRQSLAWDGRDRNGNVVADGKYSFEIKAVDADGQPVGATGLIRGKVTGVNFDGLTPVLMIGQRRVPFGNVLQVSEQSS